MVYLHLPDYRAEHTHPLDVTGFLLFGTGIGLLSYVLEVFGEHTLSAGAILAMLAVSAALLTTYGFRATKAQHPLLPLKLFCIRTFRASVSGSFFTRLGIGGIPFLFPLLYQVGLGFTPIQSGLMLMPQAVAAMSLKPLMPRILARGPAQGFPIWWPVHRDVAQPGGYPPLFRREYLGSPSQEPSGTHDRPQTE
jgi:hypothetical protein